MSHHVILHLWNQEIPKQLHHMLPEASVHKQVKIALFRYPTVRPS